MTITKTPVDSIEVPDEYVELCKNWHDGQECRLYAVSSTGGLTLGWARPSGCDTDEKWYLQLWIELSADITFVLRLAIPAHEDYDALADFGAWTDRVIGQLTKEYGLEDWERE